LNDRQQISRKPKADDEDQLIVQSYPSPPILLAACRLAVVVSSMASWWLCLCYGDSSSILLYYVFYIELSVIVQAGTVVPTTIRLQVSVVTTEETYVHASKFTLFFCPDLSRFTA